MIPPGTAEGRSLAADTTLTTVQAARGLAAVAVVLSHAATLLEAPAYLGHAPLHDVFRAGHAGVDFFFVLSGFIICTVHHRDVGRPSALADYVWKRMTRIYPAYWCGLALLILLAAIHLTGAIGLTFEHIALRPLLLSAALLPQHQAPLLGIAWTLQHEMLFYLMFGLLIANRAVGMAACGLWLALVFVATLLVVRDQWPWAPANLLFGFVGSSYHLQFLLGAGVAWLVRHGHVRVPRVVCAAGGAGLLLAAGLENSGAIAYLGLASQALFGSASACVLAGAAAAERHGGLKAGARSVFVGAASYAIYLVHVPVMAAVCPLLHAAGLIRVLPGWVLMTTLTATGIAAGVAMHVLFERPVLRWLRGVRGRGGVASRAGATASLTRAF
jgi:exopolysaccharide production protein ExoZ